MISLVPLLLSLLLWEGDALLIVPSTAAGVAREQFWPRLHKVRQNFGTQQGVCSGCGFGYGDGGGGGGGGGGTRFGVSPLRRRHLDTRRRAGEAEARTSRTAAAAGPQEEEPPFSVTPTTGASGDAPSGPLPLPPTRAPRLYLDDSNLHMGHIVELTLEQTHYLVSVMRLRDGSLVRVFDGVNGEFLATVLGNGGKSGRGSNSRPRRSGAGSDQVVTLRVDSCTRLQPGSGKGSEELGAGAPDVELIFAPIRKQRLKILVEKAVEIGASGLTPVLTARTQKSAVSDANALGKLGLTAVEAAEQCERMTIPRVGVPPVPLLSLLQDTELRHSRSREAGVEEERDTIFVCKERDLNAPPLLEALAEFARKREGDGMTSSKGIRSDSPQYTTVAFLIGPEGGFDPDEISAMATYSFVRFVSLGPTVLRAETAAMYALSSWSAFWAARL